jgi:hypothetical protein
MRYMLFFCIRKYAPHSIWEDKCYYCLIGEWYEYAISFTAVIWRQIPTNKLYDLIVHLYRYSKEASCTLLFCGWRIVSGRSETHHWVTWYSLRMKWYWIVHLTLSELEIKTLVFEEWTSGGKQIHWRYNKFPVSEVNLLWEFDPGRSGDRKLVCNTYIHIILLPISSPLSLL